MARQNPCAQEWERCLPHLRRYALWLTHRADDADDLVQTTVERGLERIDQFRYGTDMRRWLFTIMRRVHIDARRKASRRGVHFSAEENGYEEPTPGSQESHMHLREVVEKTTALSDGERRVLRLSVIEGHNHAAIAERLNVAEGTVKSRLSRARRTLASE